MKRKILACALLLCPALASAAGPLTPEEYDKGLDFSLRFDRAKAPFDYGGVSYDTASRWLGLSLREKAGRHITLGMYGGYAFVTQTGNPLTAGVELDGYHAGLSLHGSIDAGERSSIFYAFYYTYQKVDHKSDVQNVVIDWYQPEAQLGAITALTPTLRVYGGGRYGYIDGQERASGTVNRTTNFSRDSRAGGFIGIDLNVEGDGYVGIEAAAGLTRRGEIYFKRSY